MIKGKTVIELTDVNTGEKNKIEDNNMITNAVNTIMSANNLFPGAANGILALRPVYNNLFGGIYLFNSAVNENEVVIPAGAGITGYAARDYAYLGNWTQFGSYNSVESSVTDTYIKMVFDFSTSQGNGTIASVCLGDKNGAVIGIGGIDKSGSLVALSGYSKTRQIQKLKDNYDNFEKQTGIAYSYFQNGFKYNIEKGIIFTAESSNNSIVLKEVNLGIKSFKLTDTGPRVLKEKILYTGNSVHRLGYDRATKKVYFADNINRTGTSIYKDDSFKILSIDVNRNSIEDMTVEEITIPNKTGVSFSIGMNSACVYNGVVYSTSKTWLNINDYTDAGVLPIADGCSIPSLDYIIESGGIIYYTRYNGAAFDTVRKDGLKPLGDYDSSSSDNYLRAGLDIAGIKFGINRNSALCVFNNYLSTINNLATPVTKTASKTMKITYILEFADETV